MAFYDEVNEWLDREPTQEEQRQALLNAFRGLGRGIRQAGRNAADPQGAIDAATGSRPMMFDGKPVQLAAMPDGKKPYVAPAVKTTMGGAPRMPWETPGSQLKNAQASEVFGDVAAENGVEVPMQESRESIWAARDKALHPANKGATDRSFAAARSNTEQSISNLIEAERPSVKGPVDLGARELQARETIDNAYPGGPNFWSTNDALPPGPKLGVAAPDRSAFAAWLLRQKK